jgi:AcrR family transcriptional regulator
VVALADIDRMVKAAGTQGGRRDRKQEIMRAARDLAIEGKLTDWSIEQCARRAECAKGLVLHYFKSKEALLGQVALALAADRWTRWAAALSGGGIGGLDTLWDRLLEEVRPPSARALLELRLAGIEGAALPPPRALELQRLLARALDLAPDELPAAMVLEPVLEGYLLALLSGVAEEEVKEAFFRYWLTFVG